MEIMKVTVECYAGSKADERPVRFWREGRQYVVEAVVEQWYEPESLCFKVRADNGNLYVLRRQTSTPDGTWDATLFRERGEGR
jgi:hypothetical protein